MRMAFVPALLLAAAAAGQQPQCRLEGQVVDPMLAPVANAEVVATRADDGEVLARTRTDGSGAFVFGALPQDVVTVQARTGEPGLAVAWLDLLGLPRHFVRLVTVPARAVTGVVLDPDGAPVERAWVVTAPRAADDLAAAVAWARTDADGTFVLPCVPVGKNLLRAWAPGFDAFEDDLAGDGDLEVVCELPGPAKRERCFALDGAEPELLARARLTVVATHDGRPLPLPAPLQRQPIGTDGSWRLLGWSLDDAIVAWIDAGDAAFAPPVHTLDAGRSGGRKGFVRDDTQRLRGVLRGAGVRRGLRLVAQPLTAATPGRRVYGQVGDDGAFTLPPPVAEDSAFALRVLAPDVVTVRQAEGASRAWWQGPWSPGVPCDVPVTRAQRLSVTVQRPDGTPAAGAEVTIGLATAEKPRWLAGSESAPPPIASGTTGFDGRLELEGLDLQGDPQRLRLRARSPAGWVEHEFASRDADVDLGTLTMAPPAKMRVRCVDGDGAPVAGVLVYLRGASLDERRRSGRDGMLRHAGQPQDYVVFVAPGTNGHLVRWPEGEELDVTLTIRR